MPEGTSVGCIPAQYFNQRRHRDERITNLPVYFEILNATENITAAAQLMAREPILRTGDENINYYANQIPQASLARYPLRRPIVDIRYVRIGYPRYELTITHLVENERVLRMLLHLEASFIEINELDIAQLVYNSYYSSSQLLTGAHS